MSASVPGTSRAPLARDAASIPERPAGATLGWKRSRFDAALAELADEWDEQSRVLHWAFRDLGARPEELIGDSPFRAGSRPARAAIASRPAGGIPV